MLKYIIIVKNINKQLYRIDQFWGRIFCHLYPNNILGALEVVKLTLYHALEPQLCILLMHYCPKVN